MASPEAMTNEGALLMIRVMVRWGIGPYMERGTNPTESKRQGIREARGEKEGKREVDRCERQRAEDAAAPSSCPRRTYSGRFPNVRSGFGPAGPRIFGYFPSLESTSPGGEISPVRGPVRTPAPTEGIIRWRHHRRGGPMWPPSVFTALYRRVRTLPLPDWPDGADSPCQGEMAEGQRG